MKRALSIVALAALTACGGGGGGGGGGVAMPVTAATQAAPQSEPVKAPETAKAPERNCTLSLYGDSILHGGYAGGGEVVQRLAEPPADAIKRLRPAYDITDFSKNGDAAVGRVNSLVNEIPPGRVVVIEHGVNDAGSIAPADYTLAMRTMLQRVKSLGKVAIVTGLSKGGIQNRDQFNDLARQVASDEGAVFADWGTAEWKAEDMDVAGGAHPLQAYSGRLVSKLVEALDKVSPECVA
jgi:lysophospholipase L1-like esterase